MRMSVATGISPRELLALDADTFAEIEDVAASRWNVTDLLTVIAEVVHAHYRAYLSAHGVKSSQLPPPLEVPRPDRPDRKADAPRVSIRELATIGGRGVDRREVSRGG